MRGAALLVDASPRASAARGDHVDLDPRVEGGRADLDHLKRVIDRIRRSGKVTGTKT